MRSLFLIIVALFLVENVIGQQYSLKFKIDGNFDQITTDQFGNIYVVKEDQITKLKHTGDTLYEYSNKLLGKIDLIDVSQSLKAYIFYKDLSQIVILDNTLSQTNNIIALEEIGLYNVQAITASNNLNSIWVYDINDFSLKRLNKKFEVEANTGNLQMVLEDNFNINHVVEHNNSIYVSDSLKGIYVFDMFGTYVKKLPVVTSESFQVKNNEIYYLENDTIQVYNMVLFESRTIPSPVMNAKAIRIEKDFIAILEENGISVYSFNN